MSRPASRVGPAAGNPDTDAGPTPPTPAHEAQDRALSALLRMVRSGAAFEDQATAERIAVALVGAMSELRAQHPKDDRGLCMVCCSPARGWRRWPKPITCTVDEALSAFVSPAWEPL